MTVLLSVFISVGCLAAGAWGPAVGAIGVAGFALWRWTVHAKNMIWVAATVGASSTLPMGAATGSMFLGILGAVLTIAAIVYGCVSGSFRTEAKRVQRKTSSKGSKKGGSVKSKSPGGSRGGEKVDPRDVQIAEFVGLVQDLEERMRKASGQAPLTEANVQRASEQQKLKGDGGNFAAVQDFLSGGNTVGGPMTITGLNAGLQGLPPLPNGQQPPVVGPVVNPMAAIYGGVPPPQQQYDPLARGGYTLPVTVPTPKGGPSTVMVACQNGQAAGASSSTALAVPPGLSPSPSGPPRARDAFLNGLPADGLPLDHRMMGEPFYWNVRNAQYPSLTAYFEQKFPDKEDPLYLAVTTGSNSADSQIAEAHEANGMAGISSLFQRSVGLEVTLSWLASVDHPMRTGDIEGAKSLLAYRPAGTRSLLPGWAQDDAARKSKAGYQAYERATHGWGGDCRVSRSSPGPF